MKGKERNHSWGVYDVPNPPISNPLRTSVNAPPGAAVQPEVCRSVCVFSGVLTLVLSGSVEMLCVSVPAGSWSPMTHTHTHTHTHLSECSSSKNILSHIPLLSHTFSFTACV
ncbi:hypothetical protein XENOCAPTIV_013197 [Xenoophorus captivus]|uniref:Uncharacterized protein n=1 Tax=Xenoophorus captivus TaxID=1517983 RepID=A0ABV0R3K2_9TELE